MSSLMSYAEQKLDGIIIAAQHALPIVTKYVLEVTSLDAASRLLVGFVWLIAAILLLVFIPWKRFITWSWKVTTSDWFDDAGWPAVIVPAVASIPVLICLDQALGTLLDLWNWVALFRPDLYLVHLAIMKVVN